MNPIRHCCYMIGEDLGITGLKAIEEFPERDSFAQILLMSNLLTDLEQKDEKKYEVRKKYCKDILKQCGYLKTMNLLQDK